MTKQQIKPIFSKQAKAKSHPVYRGFEAEVGTALLLHHSRCCLKLFIS